MLCYLPHRPDHVLAALREGKITFLDVATEGVPDLFLHCAIDSGLLERLAKSFPDPRERPQISMHILRAAGVAGHFAARYALSQLPDALHSPKLLTLLGVQVVVQRPGKGLSRKGTREDTCFHGDVVRKLREQIAREDEKQERLPGQTLIDWYNQHVGELFCRTADAKPCIHILDCTDLVVPLKNENYEHSGVTTKNGEPERGYKLATLRSLLDEGALMTAMAWGQIHEHDLLVTNEWPMSGCERHRIFVRAIPWSRTAALSMPRRSLPLRRSEVSMSADGVQVRRIFHKLRSLAMENLNEHFKGIFAAHGPVPTKGKAATARLALGAILVYQLALVYRFEHGLALNVGLKPFLRAA